MAREIKRYYYDIGADTGDCALPVSRSFSFHFRLFALVLRLLRRRRQPSPTLLAIEGAISSLFNLTLISISRPCIPAPLCQNAIFNLDRATDVSPAHLPPRATAAPMSLAFKSIGEQ